MTNERKEVLKKTVKMWKQILFFFFWFCVNAYTFYSVLPMLSEKSDLKVALAIAAIVCVIISTAVAILIILLDLRGYFGKTIKERVKDEGKSDD